MAPTLIAVVVALVVALAVWHYALHRSLGAQVDHAVSRLENLLHVHHANLTAQIATKPVLAVSVTTPPAVSVTTPPAAPTAGPTSVKIPGAGGFVPNVPDNENPARFNDLTPVAGGGTMGKRYWDAQYEQDHPLSPQAEKDAAYAKRPDQTSPGGRTDASGWHPAGA